MFVCNFNGFSMYIWREKETCIFSMEESKCFIGPSTLVRPDPNWIWKGTLSVRLNPSVVSLGFPGYFCEKWMEAALVLHRRSSTHIWRKERQPKPG